MCMLVVIMCGLFSVDVLAASKKVKLNKTKITISVGKKEKIVLKNAKKNKIKWSAKNKKIATVNKSGIVAGKKAGKTTVTAKYKGKKYNCKVVVIKKKQNTNKAKEEETKPNDNNSPSDDKSEQEDNTPGTDSNKANKAEENTSPDNDSNSENSQTDSTTESENENGNNQTNDKKYGEMKPIVDKTSVIVKEGEEVPLTYKIENQDAGTDMEISWNTFDSDVVEEIDGKLYAKKIGKAMVCLSVSYMSKDLGYKIGVRSSTISITVTSKYEYELLQVTDFYNDDFCPEGASGFSGGFVFLETKDDSLRGKFKLDNKDTTSYIASFGYSVIKDVNVLSNNGKVEGGYIRQIDCAQIDSGYHTISYECNGVVLASKKIYIKDFRKEFDAWQYDLISKATNDSMNVHEKMTAICDYLEGKFNYHPCDDELKNKVGTITYWGPQFKTYKTTSWSVPCILYEIAQKIGYKDIINGYTEGEWEDHAYVIGTFEGQKYKYTVSSGVSPSTGAITSQMAKYDLYGYKSDVSDEENQGGDIHIDDENYEISDGAITVTLKNAKFFYVYHEYQSFVEISDSVNNHAEISVTNATNVSYKVKSGAGISVNQDGVVSVDSQSKEDVAYVIEVEADNKKYEVHGVAVEYSVYRMNQELEEWVSTNISNTMSDLERISTIQKKVFDLLLSPKAGACETFSEVEFYYAGRESGYTKSNMMVKLANMAGYDAWCYKDAYVIVYAKELYYKVTISGSYTSNRITEEDVYSDCCDLLIGYRNLWNDDYDNILMGFFGKTMSTNVTGIPEENVAPLYTKIVIPKTVERNGSQLNIDFLSPYMTFAMYEQISIEVPVDIPFGKDTEYPLPNIGPNAWTQGGYMPITDEEALNQGIWENRDFSRIESVE